LIPINAGKAHAKDANPFFMYLCFLKVDNPNNPSPRFKGKSPGGGTYLDALMELGDNTGQVVQAIRDLGNDQNPSWSGPPTGSPLLSFHSWGGG